MCYQQMVMITPHFSRPLDRCPSPHLRHCLLPPLQDPRMSLHHSSLPSPPSCILSLVIVPCPSNRRSFSIYSNDPNNTQTCVPVHLPQILTTNDINYSLAFSLVHRSPFAWSGILFLSLALIHNMSTADPPSRPLPFALATARHKFLDVGMLLFILSSHPCYRAIASSSLPLPIPASGTGFLVHPPPHVLMSSAAVSTLSDASTDYGTCPCSWYIQRCHLKLKQEGEDNHNPALGRILLVLPKLLMKETAIDEVTQLEVALAPPSVSTFEREGDEPVRRGRGIRLFKLSSRVGVDQREQFRVSDWRRRISRWLRNVPSSDRMWRDF